MKIARKGGFDHASRLILLTVVTLHCGCGRQAGDSRIAVEIPPSFLRALDSCPERAALEQRVAASLLVGGYRGTPCPLSVNDFVATGSCDDITIGIVRPLAVVYEHGDTVGAAGSVPLVWMLGWVDLRLDSLSDEQEEVIVELAAEDGKSFLIYRDADVSALPSEEDAAAVQEERARYLAEAQVWAHDLITAKNTSFDADGDDVANLLEACHGTLDAP